MACCGKWLLIIGALIGAVLIVLGAVLGFSVLPDYVHDQIAEQVRLENGTDQYKRWKELPFPLTFKVHLFEVLNPQAVAEDGAKPVVKERGPYVYDQKRHKVNIESDEDEDTLAYEQIQDFSFNAELSGDNKEEDEFFVLNTPLMGSFQTLEIIDDVVPGFISVANDNWEDAYVNHEKIGPFVKIKVRDFLFDGFKFCENIENALCVSMAGTAGQVKNLQVEADGSLSFAFFRFKDGNHDGRYKIVAGMDVVEDLGLIREWEGSTDLGVTWPKDSQCNEIRGRDSTVYPPYIEEEDEFDIFSTDICRVVRLEYYGEEEYKGVDGQRRHLKKNTLTNTGDNSCYCITMTKNLAGEKVCFPDGFMDLYNCMASAVVLSFPHFLWADKEYAETVEGLTPVEKDHITYVVLEPGTGYPLKGGKRVQFNMVLRPIRGVDVTQTLRRTMMPMLWVEEGVSLTDDLVDELKSKYLNKLILVDAVTWTLIAVGIAMLIGFGAWFLFRRK